MSIAIAFLVGFICGGCYLVSCIWPYLNAAIEFFKAAKDHETIHTAGWTEKDGQRSFAEFMSGSVPDVTSRADWGSGECGVPIETDHLWGRT